MINIKNLKIKYQHWLLLLYLFKDGCHMNVDTLLKERKRERKRMRERKSQRERVRDAFDLSISTRKGEKYIEKTHVNPLHLEAHLTILICSQLLFYKLTINSCLWQRSCHAKEIISYFRATHKC